MTSPRTADRIWLDTLWSFVSGHLPGPPARVLDLGCGPMGGFVPAMLDAGYDALGVDPEAPAGPPYRQARFEDVEVGPVDAVAACTSLHHVSDLDEIAERITEILRPQGALVVVEWAWERFDEATARWCFDRLGDDEGWLHHHWDRWRDSGDDWPTYLRRWAAEESLHRGEDVIAALTRHLDVRLVGYDAYFFAELDPPAVADERAAIDAGDIQATGIRFVGRPQRT